MSTIARALAVVALAISTPCEAASRGTSEVAQLKLIYELGGCIVKNLPQEATRVVGLSADSSQYRDALRSLQAEAQPMCAKTIDTFVPSAIAERTLAGCAIAESLLELSTAPNLETRLASVPPGGLKGANADERTDLCVVGSSRSQVIALLATDPGGPGEATAARAILDGEYSRCAIKSGIPKSFVNVLEPSVFSLRAGLAVAALKLLLTAEGTPDA